VDNRLPESADQAHHRHGPERLQACPNLPIKRIIGTALTLAPEFMG
jgi:hypothetical protein